MHPAIHQHFSRQAPQETIKEEPICETNQTLGEEHTRKDTDWNVKLVYWRHIFKTVTLPNPSYKYSRPSPIHRSLDVIP